MMAQLWYSALMRGGDRSSMLQNLLKLSINNVRYCASASSMYFTDKYDLDEPKFSKILIANRGEIACRVIKSCRALGIKSVAVHSDVDSLAKHVKMADEAICIGPAPSAESYLRMDAILDACKKTGAQAVHPGYGFLSENTKFAKLLADNDIVFIGPSSEPIRAMGDKIESKKIAKKAGVNCIPGFDGVVKDTDEAIKIANEIGYPVMIKASAGGGGKGMRIAWDDKQAKEGFRLSSQEAASSFGDDRLLIEKYVDNPRHIEVQVLCDKHGNAIHLNERECSIQRRNQKVIEESPSPFVDAALRQKMGEQAVALALAVGYDSAGTVEFLVDSQKNFYFLEMNTRLQVEHPITEYVTGVDLVHQMIRVGKGHKLKLSQKDIPVKGHSIECRIYAEDPFKNFGMPSVGRLVTYQEPLYLENVRCDSGIREGSEISIYYDPLICKLVTYGETREESLDNMIKALDHYVIRGVIHNIPLLRDIMTEDVFRSGVFNTKYLFTTFPDGFKGKDLDKREMNSLLSTAACLYVLDFDRCKTFTNQSRLPLRQRKKTTWSLNVIVNKESQLVEVTRHNDVFKIKIGDSNIEIPTSDIKFGELVLEPKINGKSEVFQLIRKSLGGVFRIRYLGTAFNVQVMRSKAVEFLQMMPEKAKPDLSKVVSSPMSGMVKNITCAVNKEVIEGEEVCVVEAMKMQNSVVVESSGRVKAIHCKVGDTVSEGDVLIELV